MRVIKEKVQRRQRGTRLVATAIVVALLSLGIAPSDDEAATSIAADGPVAVQRAAFSSGMSDQAIMILVGTVLIALGALIRRADNP